MGTYGSMLSHFPELFRTVSFWERKPRLDAGYVFDDRDTIRYRVIILTDAQAKFQDKKVAEYKALDFANHDVMYSLARTPIEKGMFLRHPDDDQIYIVDEPFDYAFTGDYRMWGIERVQGATGENQAEEFEPKRGIY